MGYRIAVVGATGNVGHEMLNILAERAFPIDEIVTNSIVVVLEGDCPPPNNPRPPVLFLSVVVPFGSVNQFCETNPAPPWNVGPAVASTLLVSPGFSVVIPMGLSVAVGVGELVRSPIAAMTFPVFSAKIFSPSYNPRKTVSG